MERDGELDDLAGRFIRLWEEAWQQLAQDPDIARHWANLFAALGQGWPPPGDASSGASGNADERSDAAPDRPATAADAPVDGGERADQLARRVRELEERVAGLARRLDRRTRG